MIMNREDKIDWMNDEIIYHEGNIDYYQKSLRHTHTQFNADKLHKHQKALNVLRSILEDYKKIL